MCHIKHTAKFVLYLMTGKVPLPAGTGQTVMGEAVRPHEFGSGVIVRRISERFGSIVQHGHQQALCQTIDKLVVFLNMINDPRPRSLLLPRRGLDQPSLLTGKIEDFPHQLFGQGTRIAGDMSGCPLLPECDLRHRLPGQHVCGQRLPAQSVRR